MRAARSLGRARTIGEAVDAEILRCPGFNTLEVCGALGAVAGVVVAQALPSATAEVDEAHLDAMARAYREALLEMLVRDRKARAAGVN